MKYLMSKFSSPANSDEFRDNWDSVFGSAGKALESKPHYRIIVCNACGEEHYASKEIPDDHYNEGCPVCDTTK